MLAVTSLTKTFEGGKQFGRVMAVDGIDFTVKEGDFFTLLGPSGCGKTTTLRCIAGLERPRSGEITISDRTVYSSSKNVFVQPNERNIGMVFQSYAIWPHMNVFENVAFPLKVGGRKIPKEQIKQRVMQVLEVVELGHLADRYATKLSGGQQQRLALARALVIEPNLLLLDEPLSNLDAKLRESLRFELKRLQREKGITTIYVTHDQAEALALSNVIGVMRTGHLLQIGTPREIYEEPHTQFVADFIGSTNFVQGTFQGQSSTPDTWVVETNHGPLHVCKTAELKVGDRCAVSIRPEHIQILRDADDTRSVNVWSGAIKTRLFVGEVMDYQIEVGEAEFRCRTPASLSIPTGRTVGLYLPPEHCAALVIDV